MSKICSRGNFWQLHTHPRCNQGQKEQFVCLFVYFKRLRTITFALICHRIVIVAMSYYNPLIKIVKRTSLSHFPKTTHSLKYDHPCELP